LELRIESGQRTTDNVGQSKSQSWQGTLFRKRHLVRSEHVALARARAAHVSIDERRLAAWRNAAHTEVKRSGMPSMIQIKKILVPTDFSEFGQQAIRYGCEFARRFSAQLTLLHVVEDIYPIYPEPGMLYPSVGDDMAELQDAAKKAIDRLPGNQLATGIDISREIVVGTPFLEIIRYARESETDLIIIGTHGRTGLIHALMGSVAEKIVRKAPCPVLSIRPEGHGFVMP
jgi:nucleotide-binding universal stress UspA family protein